MNPFNPLQLVSSALSPIGSAIAGTPSTATSGADAYGNTDTSGAPISSGGGQSSGVSIWAIGIIGIVGLIAWKHFAK